jgi:hypothetical protein
VIFQLQYWRELNIEAEYKFVITENIPFQLQIISSSNLCTTRIQMETFHTTYVYSFLRIFSLMNNIINEYAIKWTEL